ncbi:type II toxin-antitoxin system HicA family toxin [Methanimicrococcus sp. OttesenSCG-928-J09]|nr:type II toxin-antitoxin system HicA family toxin [Methanimicrococcus sp. OttesenSCG-928-J09]
MLLKSREIETALKKKGFIEVRKGDHKQFYYLDDIGNTFIKTRISHGNPEYGGQLLASLMKQLHLTSSQMKNLINCPLTKEELCEIYAQEMKSLEIQKLGNSNVYHE